MNKYKYSRTWFIGCELNKKLLSFVDKSTVHTILEIGCYEGLSSVYFADNLLDHPTSSLTCVDPFLNIENNDHKQYLMNNEEMNFNYNISVCKNSNKISVHKIMSDDFFTINTKMYDLIYIDGSHECDNITRDMEHSFSVLKPQGIMWMDDYGGGGGIKIKNTMNKFLEKYIHQYNIIHKGYQLAIRKK